MIGTLETRGRLLNYCRIMTWNMSPHKQSVIPSVYNPKSKINYIIGSIWRHIFLKFNYNWRQSFSLKLLEFFVEFSRTTLLTTISREMSVQVFVFDPQQCDLFWSKVPCAPVARCRNDCPCDFSSSLPSMSDPFQHPYLAHQGWSLGRPIAETFGLPVFFETFRWSVSRYCDLS